MQTPRFISYTEVMLGIYITLWALAADGNHDAKRAALDLLLILI